MWARVKNAWALPKNFLPSPPQPNNTQTYFFSLIFSQLISIHPILHKIRKQFVFLGPLASIFHNACVNKILLGFCVLGLGPNGSLILYHRSSPPKQREKQTKS